MQQADDEGRMAPPKGSDEYKQLLDHGLSRIHQGEDAHRRLVPGWQDNYRAFRAWRTSTTPAPGADWQSDVRAPYVAEQVLTMQPRQVEGKPVVDVMKQNPWTPNEIPRKMARYATNNLWQDQFAMKAARLSLHNLLYGVGWGKQSFAYQDKMRDVVNRQTGQVMRTPVIVMNRPTSSIPNPLNVIWDPRAETMETCRYIIVRTITTVDQVRAKERRKVGIKKPDGSVIEEYRGMYSNTEYVTDWAGSAADRERLPGTYQVPTYVSGQCKDGSVEVLEILDTERDRLLVIANRCVVLRDQEMPWWHGQIPIACAVTTPDVQGVKGLSMVDWIRPLQEMLHLLENQKLDNTRLQMDMVLLVRDTLQDLDDYVLGPGEKWPVGDPTDVSVLQYPQPQLASMGDIESIRGRLQAIVGSSYMTGGDPSSMGMSQDTASGLMSIIEEGNRRVDFQMNLMTMCYERMIQQNLSDAAQFLENQVYVPHSVKGMDPIPVTPQELNTPAWVKVELSSQTGSRSLKQQMVTSLLVAAQQFKGTPIPTPDGVRMFNDKPLIDMMAEAWDAEPEEFLFDPQVMAQVGAAQAPLAGGIAADQQAAGNPTQFAMPGLPAPTVGAPS